jgi:DNA polymerase sigma
MDMARAIDRAQKTEKKKQKENKFLLTLQEPVKSNHPGAVCLVQEVAAVKELRNG